MSSTTKGAGNVPCGYSFSVSANLMIKNGHDVWRGEDYMKKNCDLLKEHAMGITNFEMKKIILLTDKECKSYANEQYCHIWRKIFK